MSILEGLLTPWTLVALVLSYWLVPYVRAYQLARIPAPFPAAFTNCWLMLHCRRGRRYAAVDKAHKILGPVVRIQPNHISFADSDAIPIIYGHGNGFLKSEYYDAFVSIQRGIFTTRDRAEHTRKRKVVSHTFSPRSVTQFEQYIHNNLEVLVKQWNGITRELKKGGFADMECLSWFNYLSFDIIGDLAFGAPFGMLEEGKDITKVQMSPDAPVTYTSAIRTINRRGEVSATLGCYPQIKPYAKWLPDDFFSKGLEAVEKLAGIAVARVGERLKPEAMATNQRTDLLARLMEGKDAEGKKLGREELTAEALTQLIAGSDTISNTSCAIVYWVSKTPGVQEKLQDELDAAIPDGSTIPYFASVKDLPYLRNVINETLRIHSTSSLGLPRQVPPGPGISFKGYHFPAGTCLSVPAYTIHHSTSIWGPDADSFRPERWDNLDENMKNAFIPFSYGPRACVGRNVAEMELVLIVSTVFRKFEMELRQGKLETREGFLRKPLACLVGVRRRV